MYEVELMKNKTFILTIALSLTVGVFSFNTHYSLQEEKIVSYSVDLKAYDVKLYWKDDKGSTLNSIQNLKNYLDKNKLNLVFAANAGMYKADHSPQGLFIQEKKLLAALDTSSGGGNFYMKPNGIFYITTDNKAAICETGKFIHSGQINYATQSGPMLVIDGSIHPAFKEGSANLNIRNGVGILPNNDVVFAMSKEKINFYDFANYFKSLGCKQALYLDGFVSRTYLPEKNWVQTDGNFGVMIGVTEKK
ncbi:MAG: hypothetical protein K0R51_602 [Cytophagaceae bacterium]|jgi:uncharacterized protein YigE (DUF2233 family)|nr:hypothetical protein [Cytophagaceae bacterium]